MNIESRGISITDVPRVRSIVVGSDTASIQFEYSESIWTWTFAELREFHEAIGEALKHAPTVTPANPEKTEWFYGEGDPEPEGVTAVIDGDGDRWDRSDIEGWSLRSSENYRHVRWEHILREHGPLRLPEDAE